MEHVNVQRGPDWEHRILTGLTDWQVRGTAARLNGMAESDRGRLPANVQKQLRAMRRRAA